MRITNDFGQALPATFRFELPGLLKQPFEVEQMLAPHSTQEILIKAAFDLSVLQRQGPESVQAELELEYGEGPETTAIKRKEELTVYGRGSLHWDNVSRAAAFITPADVHVAAFARKSLVAFEGPIKQYGKPLANLTRALVLFEALKGFGLRYLADANSPYAKAAADRAAVDHIQYPAQLLHTKSGDCDDLTVLYASLLENAGVPTALVDFPGHIFLVFDTGIHRLEAFKLPLEPHQYIVRGDRIWIPVEVTALDQPFASAWQAGLEQLMQLSKWERRQLVIETAAAWAQYPPASPTFATPSEGPEPGVYQQALLAQHRALEQQVFEYLDDHYRNPIKAQPDNIKLRLELGRLYLALRLYDTAIEAAYDYLRRPGGETAAAYNHLGIVYFFKQEFRQAAFYLGKAALLAPKDGRIRHNLARVKAALGEDDPTPKAVVEEGIDTGVKGAATALGEDGFYWVE